MDASKSTKCTISERARLLVVRATDANGPRTIVVIGYCLSLVVSLGLMRGRDWPVRTLNLSG